jgi:hypothetical protein
LCRRKDIHSVITFEDEVWQDRLGMFLEATAHQLKDQLSSTAAIPI